MKNRSDVSMSTPSLDCNVLFLVEVTSKTAFPLLTASKPDVPLPEWQISRIISEEHFRAVCTRVSLQGEGGERGSASLLIEKSCRNCICSAILQK